MKILWLTMFVMSAAQAGPFGLGDPVYIPPTITPTIQPLQPTPTYPLSFCGQYPNAEACKSKPEKPRTKCIDGTVYHEQIDRGDHYWVQSHDPDGTIIICRDNKE